MAEPVGGGEPLPRLLLRLQQLPLQDLPVRERLLGDKGRRGVVLQRVEQRGRLGGALRRVAVADGLQGLAEPAVGVCETGVRLLHGQLAQLEAVVGFVGAED